MRGFTSLHCEQIRSPMRIRREILARQLPKGCGELSIVQYPVEIWPGRLLRKGVFRKGRCSFRPFLSRRLRTLTRLIFPDNRC